MMFAPVLRSAAGLAGIMVVALSIPVTASHAIDLGKDDEVSIRGEIVAADPNTRMIIVEVPSAIRCPIVSSRRWALRRRVTPSSGCAPA